ncbi:MAG: ferredoxin--nitrite reductase [Chloroflexi bacterium]|nr:ferredoxin--nitrite reductase [Chloroflexota bacterium]
MNNHIETYKREKDGLDILRNIQELAAYHDRWETIEASERERLKWIGTFFCQPAPGQFMMRIRMTNGQVTASQLRLLALLSRRFGNGIVDLTTRQQLELRAIKIRDVPEILEALRGVDLTSLQTGMDNVRNVVCCPLAGLSPEELFDASPIVAEFTRMFLGNRAFSNLPRKFNVTMTGCTENCAHAESQDLAMTPAVRESDGIPGFNVAVGGRMGSGMMKIAQPLGVFVERREAASLAAQVAMLFRDEGFREQRARSRLSFLVEDWGVERFKQVLQGRWGKLLEKAQRDARLTGRVDHLGVRRQKQPGMVSVGLCVPAGRLSADQLDELAYLSERYGNGDARLTTDQNVILVNLPEPRLSGLLSEPLLQRLSPSPHHFLRGLVTCTGTDYCKLAQIETKSLGLRLAKEMARQFPDASPVTMHWSGCSAGCGNHQVADMGFQGVKAQMNGEATEAVSIFVGGRSGVNAKSGERIVEALPVSLLGEVLPSILENLNVLNRVRRPRVGEKRVLVVPVFSARGPRHGVAP